MRHIWSLAVEEQYYLIWPLLVLGLTKIVGCIVGPANDADDVIPSGMTKQQHMVRLVRTPRMRAFIVCLLFFECIAIFASHHIALWTYRNEGPSAAYYLTWTRAGEFAVGGLSACFLHLEPHAHARYLRIPDLPKMSLGHRIFLELAATCCLFGIISVPMLPVPQHALLNHYFSWMRLPATMLVLLPAPASDLQGTEPLPWWALSSRVFHSPVLVHLGIMCYGESSNDC